LFDSEDFGCNAANHQGWMFSNTLEYSIAEISLLMFDMYLQFRSFFSFSGNSVSRNYDDYARNNKKKEPPFSFC